MVDDLQREAANTLVPGRADHKQAIRATIRAASLKRPRRAASSPAPTAKNGSTAGLAASADRNGTSSSVARISEAAGAGGNIGPAQIFADAHRQRGTRRSVTSLSRHGVGVPDRSRAVVCTQNLPIARVRDRRPTTSTGSSRAACSSRTRGWIRGAVLVHAHPRRGLRPPTTRPDREEAPPARTQSRRPETHAPRPPPGGGERVQDQQAGTPAKKVGASATPERA